MSKRYVPVLECRIGDILAKDVLNSRGNILVTKNSTITQYIKDKLLEKELCSVWIYEDSLSSSEVKTSQYEAFCKNYKGFVFVVKELFEELSVGEKFDVEKIIRLGKDMFGSFEDNRLIIKYLLNEIERFDEYTHSHSVNVALYSYLIAKWLDLPDDRAMEVSIAGLVHDIGKIMIPKEILNKKGQLTEQEFAIMKYHPILGYESIKDSPELDKVIKEVVLSHHERLDGSGYPYGLAGGDLDLYTRIVSIADVYDAMTQNRVYKKRVSPFEAFKIMKTEGLEIFDIEIMEVFLTNIAGLLVGMNAVLDNGEVGEIVYIPPHDISNPLINLGSTIIDISKSSVRIESVI